MSDSEKKTLTAEQQQRFKTLEQGRQFIRDGDDIIARSDTAKSFLHEIGVNYGPSSRPAIQLQMSEAVADRKQLEAVMGTEFFASVFPQRQVGG